jgi:hypothetical protein
MNPAPSTTESELILVASDALIRGGYRRIESRFPEWDTPTSRLFENEFSVVAVAVFGTCSDLLDTWPSLQGSLVELMTRNVSQTESKSWDGYLVLLTPAVVPSELVHIEEVRYDTSRVRKLVATGDDLRAVGGAERVLSPLLPLGADRVSDGQESVLDMLPGLLARAQVDTELTKVVVNSFLEQAPMMDRLHELRTKYEARRT